MRYILILLLCLLSGCTRPNLTKQEVISIPVVKEVTPVSVSKEEQFFEAIEGFFNKEQFLIWQAFIKEGCDKFIMARLIDNYGTEITLEGFITYMKEEIHKEFTISDEMLDKILFNAVRLNYGLFKKIYEKKED